jgi:hypothetical protein
MRSGRGARARPGPDALRQRWVHPDGDRERHPNSPPEARRGDPRARCHESPPSGNLQGAADWRFRLGQGPAWPATQGKGLRALVCAGCEADTAPGDETRLRDRAGRGGLGDRSPPAPCRPRKAIRGAEPHEVARLQERGSRERRCARSREGRSSETAAAPPFCSPQSRPISFLIGHVKSTPHGEADTASCCWRAGPPSRDAARPRFL